MVEGDKLHAARRALRMTQAQLAKSAGVSPRTVRRAESGLDVSDESLRCICAVLGVDCASVGSHVPPAPEGDAGGIAKAMACPDPCIHDRPPPSVRLPTLGEYLGQGARGILRDEHIAVVVLLLFFTMTGAGMTTLCIGNGYRAWAIYFGTVAAIAYVLSLLAGDGIEKQGKVVYAFRNWTALALAPMSALACGVMAATHPAFAGVGVFYLMSCAVLGLLVSAGGAYRLLGLRRMEGWAWA